MVKRSEKHLCKSVQGLIGLDGLWHEGVGITYYNSDDGRFASHGVVKNSLLVFDVTKPEERAELNLYYLPNDDRSPKPVAILSRMPVEGGIYHARVVAVFNCLE